MGLKGNMCIKSKNEGFTLLELLIGIFVMIIALFSLLNSNLAGFKLNEISKDNFIATADAQRVIEQIRSRANTSMSLITGENWTLWAASNGCILLSGEQILVNFIDRDGNGNPFDDNPLEVSVNVIWQERGRARLLSFSTLVTAH